MWKEKKEIEKPIYSGNSVVDLQEKKVFKPTPIISPVYGILDKNYHKEDIVSRDEVIARKESNVESSIDLVRNKAYGTLEDELEDTLNSMINKKKNLANLSLERIYEAFIKIINGNYNN